MQKPEIADTSVFRMMGAMMADTHEQRGIAVLSGPPGIGKTTAIDAFADEYEGQCLVTKLTPAARGGEASPIAVVQALIDAYADQFGGWKRHSMKAMIAPLIQDFRNMLISQFRNHPEDMQHSRLTLVFDEAQHISRRAIDMLRYWNDTDRPLMPFPFGLVFVGNNEFALAASARGESVLSDAVRDRILHYQQLGYGNVSDDDIRKVVAGRGITDPGAAKVILAYFETARLHRSLRQLNRILEKCSRIAGDAPITAQLVNDILNPQ